MGRSKLTPREEALKPVISANIRYYLDKVNKRPADLQRATGIAQSTVSDYTSGKTLVNPANAEKIAIFFGIRKVDIDPRFGEEWVAENDYPIIKKTIQKMKQLEDTHQENVLSFAEKQLQKQQAKINETEIYQLPNIKRFDDSDFINVPVLGNIAAGIPIYADENFEGYRPVSDKYGDAEDIFWLQAYGNSMINLIYNRDYVLIEKTSNVENGEIAAVLFTEDNSATLKRVYKEKKQLRLVAENSEYQDIIADGDNPAIILGRAIKIERDI